MIGTFSVYIGQVIETTSYPLHSNLSIDGFTQSDLLYPLRDNEDKLISPINLRNAIFSFWTSLPFKETSIDGTPFIGIDAIDPLNKDLKRKIFLGKRSFSPTQSYLPSDDIMNSTLLSSDTDIFFFNTKKDSILNNITRLSIITGSNKSEYSQAPFIQSEKISGTTQSLSLDLVSRSGNLNIGYNPNVELGMSSSGTFSLNGIILPSIDDSTSLASNNKLWFYQNGEMVWDELTLPLVSTIGTTGSSLDIFGTPTNVNDYSLDFNDSRLVPTSIGGVSIGTSFNNVALTEVLRNLIYTYIPPSCLISIDNGFGEVGTYPEPVLTYTIEKKTNNTAITILSNMIPGFYPEIINNNLVTITSTAIGIVGQLNTIPKTFTISVTDGISSTSASTTMVGIYPYFYGFYDGTSDNISIVLNTLTKDISSKSNKLIDISGIGSYYFIYDNTYGPLTSILDSIGIDVINDFTIVNRILSKSPWATKEFIVYKKVFNTQIGPPSINYEFRY